MEKNSVYDEMFEKGYRLVNGKYATPDEMQKMLERMRWIPVSERLPEKGKRVIVYYNSTIAVDILKQLYDDGKWYVYFSEVTHWMPLPSLSKEMNNEK